MKNLLLFVTLILCGCRPANLPTTPIVEGEVSFVSIKLAKSDAWMDLTDKGYIQVYPDYIIYTHPEGYKYVVPKEDARDIRIKAKGISP